MFKSLHNCTHLTHQQRNAQSSPSQASTVCELRTSRCSSWIQKSQKNQRSNCQHPLDHRKSKRIIEKTSTSASLTMLKPLTVWITTNCGIFLKRWKYQTIFLPPEKTVYRTRSNSQKQTWNNRLVQNWERSISRFILSPCLFNLYHAKCQAG